MERGFLFARTILNRIDEGYVSSLDYPWRRVGAAAPQLLDVGGAGPSLPEGNAEILVVNG
jgi:hypothetical protein